MDSSSRLLVFWGITFTSITAAVVYLLLRKDEETGHDGSTRSSRRAVIKVKVPHDLIGTVIGKGGCNVRAIQDKSGARVNFNDESSTETFRVVTIQGAPESAQLAESMIHEIIMNQPLIITHEMWVPLRAVGRIIGRGGETIRNITRVSCAKIMVDSAGGGDERERRVVLKGTTEQISHAKTLIEEKVQEDDDLRRRVEMSIANRSPRREPRDNYNYLMAPSNEDVQLSPCRIEKFDSIGSDGFFDVFVSACSNPGQFWVQLVSPRGVELDQLVDKMTEYYTNPENHKLHALEEISVGQIVAAPFDHDDKWYRAEILKIDEDEYDSSESNVTLYYGDYGDSRIVKRKYLLDLRTDFLTLYFQAIECMLAHIKPKDEEWSDAATELFEELTEVALWQKKVAHVVTYRESPHKMGKRAGSPVPVIELHDKNGSIGEELVKQGFAEWECPSPPNTSDKTIESGADSSLPSEKKLLTSPEPSLAAGPGSFSDLPEASDAKRMTPAAVFGTESKPAKGSEGSDSSSFISQERKQKAVGGFKPKTLETTQKKQKSQSIKAPVYLPEDLSDDDSEDGFTLE